MFGIGFGEIVIIALLALILFGQDDLPANIRKAANGLKEFRKVSSNAQRAWHEVRSDMTRALLEESDREVNEKQRPGAIRSGASAAEASAPESSLVVHPVEPVQDDGTYHPGRHDYDDAPDTALQEKPKADTVVIKAPEGIIAQGTQGDDDVDTVQKKPNESPTA